MNHNSSLLIHINNMIHSYILSKVSFGTLDTVGIAQQIANSSQYCHKFWELFSLCAGADDYYFFQNRTASPEMVILAGFYL